MAKSLLFLLVLITLSLIVLAEEVESHLLNVALVPTQTSLRRAFD